MGAGDLRICDCAIGVAICKAHGSGRLIIVSIDLFRCMGRVSFDCKLSLKATLDTRDRIKEKHDYMNYFKTSKFPSGK